MADSASFDFSALNKLAADIDKAPREARPALRKATEITARKVKDTWRGKLGGSSTLPGLPAAVSYDISSDNSSRAPIEAEIGFDKDKAQGALGNISEFGTPKTAPRGFGLASLEENAADFECGIGKAISDSLDGLGL